MFKTRLLSGIVLVAAALVLIITGGDVLLFSTLLISYIGMFELYRIFHVEKELPGIVGYLAATVFYCNLKWDFLPDIMVVVLGFLMALMFVYVFTYPKYKTEHMLAVFFGLFYVAVMLSYVYQTRMLNAGAYIVWLIFLCSWGCDTCAYCVGMLIGKHKMSPKLSPKKSVEGAIGGVVGAALLTVIYGMIFKNAMGVTMQHVWIMAAISAVGALISMVGDLTASAIKRNYEIKDYGKLIPGYRKTEGHSEGYPEGNFPEFRESAGGFQGAGKCGRHYQQYHERSTERCKSGGSKFYGAVQKFREYFREYADHGRSYHRDFHRGGYVERPCGFHAEVQ